MAHTRTRTRFTRTRRAKSVGLRGTHSRPSTAAFVTGQTNRKRRLDSSRRWGDANDPRFVMAIIPVRGSRPVSNVPMIVGNTYPVPPPSPQTDTGEETISLRSPTVCVCFDVTTMGVFIRAEVLGGLSRNIHRQTSRDHVCLPTQVTAVSGSPVPKG